MKKYFLSLLVLSSFLTTEGFTDGTAVSILESPEEAQKNVEQRLQQSRQFVAVTAHEDAFVMQKFDLFSEALHYSFYSEKSMTQEEVFKICEATDFAADKHRFQTRKNKEKTPYISHPIGVAHIVMQIGNVRDSAVIMGALLHDTVEDTQTTYEELTERFGTSVAGYVEEMTDDKALSFEERKRLQVINAVHMSKGAAQIKLADKLYNVSDLLENPPANWTQARVDRYFEWARSVTDRLPESNISLKSAVVEAIDSYWGTQEKKIAKK